MSVIDAIIAKKLCGGGGGSVPKPLTYDYMPEGYPTKSVQTTTLMEEQQLAFTHVNAGIYGAFLTNALDIVGGQTYTVNWDGTEYECVGVDDGKAVHLGNNSIFGSGNDTGEPFLYDLDQNAFATLDTAASHTISVKRTEEIVTPISREFLPDIPAGGVTTLHINVTAVNMETMEATFTADKTPLEMQQAAVNGPVWCVVTIAAGLMGEEAVSFGVPPAWYNGIPAFGKSTNWKHDEDGANTFGYVAREAAPDRWSVDITQLGG